MASLCSNENIPITDKLFGDDADIAIKTARETFKIKNYHSGGQPPHPYKRGQNRPFLGQIPPQYSQRGSYSNLRGREKPWNQRGVGKFRGVQANDCTEQCQSESRTVSVRVDKQNDQAKKVETSV